LTGLIIPYSANGMRLDDYMRKNIWDPLNVNGMTFHLERSDLSKSLVDMSVRLGGENKYGTPANPAGEVVWSEDKVWKPMEEESGGAGIYVSS
jgi:CubicO group peptidase (beta-lactamase class C family)